MLHSDSSGSNRHQCGCDLRCCRACASIGCHGLFEPLAEVGIVPAPPSRLQDTIQRLLEFRCGQDSLSQGIPTGLPLSLPKRQLEKLSSDEPLNLLTNGRVEGQFTGVQILRYALCTDRLCASRCELCGQLRHRKGDIRRRLEHIPADCPAMDGCRAGE
jgi:hypothetical protein